MPRRKMTYAEKRKRDYLKKIPIEEQLDAILKAFDIVLQSGGDLPFELIDVIEKWQEIKFKYPKE
ncbi:MAG: hypothetical protein LBR70_05140 [Lactobacillaceae bacterium]|jgi:hypothetical protein|nr:hypothetical protein [Lactobacillaceae bacterium]